MRNWVRRHAAEVALVALIVIGGAAVRFIDVGPSMHFGTDEGRDAFVVHDFVTGESVPLLGPAAPNNRPDFHLGAFFYYLLTPGYALLQSSPMAGALTIAILSTASIILVYGVGRTLWDWRAGVAAAALYSTSFLMVYYGRWAWNPNVAPFFMLLIIWCVIQIIQHKTQPSAWYLYGAGLGLGFIVQLHGTALLVVPLMLVVLGAYYRPRFRWWQYLVSLFLVAFTNLPTIIYDLTHRFANARGFIRVMLQSDSTAALSLGDRIDRLYHLVESFFQESLAHGLPVRLWQGLVVITIIGIGFHVIRTWTSSRQRPSIIILAVWLIVPIVIFSQYQEAIPPHYFALLFPLPFLFIGWLVYAAAPHRLAQLAGWSIVLVLCFTQAWFSVQLLYDITPHGSRASSYPLRLDEMETAVQTIVDESNGAPFTFQSYPIGAYDRSFAYLFMRAGHEPSILSGTFDYRVVLGTQYPFEQWDAFGDIQSMQQAGPLWVLRVDPPRP